MLIYYRQRGQDHPQGSMSLFRLLSGRKMFFRPAGATRYIDKYAVLWRLINYIMYYLTIFQFRGGYACCASHCRFSYLFFLGSEISETLHCTFVKSLRDGYDIVIFDNALLGSSKFRRGHS